MLINVVDRETSLLLYTHPTSLLTTSSRICYALCYAPGRNLVMLFILLSALDDEDEKLFFARFYQQNKNALFRYACTLCPSYALAEEALQEGWLRCVQNSSAFFSVQPDKRFAWMIVVVKHAAFDLLRKEARHHSLPPDWDGPAPEDGDTTDIVDIIRSMPPQYRTILEMKFVLELSDKEIAKRVGLSVTAVSSRINRGRKLLKQKLTEEGYHD